MLLLAGVVSLRSSPETTTTTTACVSEHQTRQQLIVSEMRGVAMMMRSALSLLWLTAVTSGRISHVVVLMMENRSFDHILGWLKALNSKIDGLTEGMTVPRDPNDVDKGSVPVTRNGYDVSPDDPLHDFDNIAIQINNNAMDGFVYDSIQGNRNETNPVSMFDEKSAPILNELAMEFAVFDNWFCSIPGPTDPNRQYAMSGTSDGVITNFNGTLYGQQSYFDYLRQNGHSFAGYYQDDLWALGYFDDMVNTDNNQFVYELEPNFFDDAKAGNLPEFTWLQPRSGTHRGKMPTWQHPDASVIEGEKLIKDVYEALRSSPVWDSTVFLITYDEHGGFYDHVPPPDEGVPYDGNPAPNGFEFDRLGVRVPTVAISPWIPKGTVIHDALSNEQPTPYSAFESTSILSTTNILLGLTDAGVAPLTERISWANSFAGLFDMLDEPREDCPMTLADIPDNVTPELYALQRAKPLNEHLEGQLIYFCAMNHPEEHSRGACPGRPEIKHSQGLASDWISAELEVFLAKIKS